MNRLAARTVLSENPTKLSQDSDRFPSHDVNLTYDKSGKVCLMTFGPGSGLSFDNEDLFDLTNYHFSQIFGKRYSTDLGIYVEFSKTGTPEFITVAPNTKILKKLNNP